MPLSDTDIVQTNQGGFEATTGTVSLPVGTTAGNTVIILFVGYAQTTGSISGFTKRSPASGNSARLHVFDRPNVGAGENNWTIGSGISGVHAWVAYELQGALDFDVGAAAVANTSSGTSVATNTSPTSTTYDGWVVAVHCATDTGAAPTLSSQTGGFTERLEQAQTGVTKGATVAVSDQFTQALSTFASTATCSVTLDATDPASAWVAVYSAQGAKRAPDLAMIFGAEIGTAAGLNTGNANCAPVDAMTGSPAITASTPRSGSYCLELSSTAAAENVQWTNGESLGLVAPGTYQRLVLRCSVRFPGSLPSGDVDLLAAGSGASSVVSCAQLRFRSASSKLGLTVQGASAGGTEQLSVSTVAADVWYSVDLRFDMLTATWAADWRLDGVGQTQATKSGEAANQTPSIVVVGWTTAITATVRYDDIVISKVAGHYPLGDFQVLPITVDPAGTLTVSGTAGNFQTFTANGTMAAWNATTARGNIDEVPPTIGASADGLAQITAAAGDYVEIPMTTVAGAPNGSVRGVRWYFCGWAASATAATIGFRDHDGVAEHTLFAAADPNFDNSTTDPAWVCRMAGRTELTGGAPTWTQAKMDALVARVGFSDDATPDIGVHAVIGEVAKQMAGAAAQHFGDLATSTRDRGTDGIIAIAVTPTAGYDATLHYEEGGSPTNVATPGGTTTTEVIDAPDAPAVNYIALYPPPEDTPDA